MPRASEPAAALARPEPTAGPVQTFVSLGANLGDPRAQVLRALEELEALGRVRASSLYRTEPLGPRPQPWFLNAVAELHTRLAPGALLAELQAIERRAGRRRTWPWGPRTLDLDLLLYGERCIDAPGLVVPHPEWHRRRFVLVPLAELAPERTDPRSGRTARELLAALDDPSQVEKLPADGGRAVPYDRESA